MIRSDLYQQRQTNPSKNSGLRRPTVGIALLLVVVHIVVAAGQRSDTADIVAVGVAAHGVMMADRGCGGCTAGKVLVVAAAAADKPVGVGTES